MLLSTVFMLCARKRAILLNRGARVYLLDSAASFGSWMSYRPSSCSFISSYTMAPVPAAVSNAFPPPPSRVMDPRRPFFSAVFPLLSLILKTTLALWRLREGGAAAARKNHFHSIKTDPNIFLSLPNVCQTRWHLQIDNIRIFSFLFSSTFFSKVHNCFCQQKISKNLLTKFSHKFIFHFIIYEIKKIILVECKINKNV